MELFQLRSFLRVAETGSITRASEALFLTQPAVTQHVRALERELGVALFDRTGRGVQLTAAGEVLVEYAKRSLAALDEGRQVIADLESGAAGRLLLGAGVTTSIFNLPEWLRAFGQTYPGVDVVVRTGRSKEVAGWVLDREIDLGLVTSPVELRELTVIDLYDEEIVLVGPQDRQAQADMPLILFPKGSGFRDYLDRALADAGVAIGVKMETDSVEAIKGFVQVGLGASLLPLSSVEAEIRSGQLVRVALENMPELRRKTSIIYRADRYMSRAANGFLKLLSGRFGR